MWYLDVFGIIGYWSAVKVLSLTPSRWQLTIFLSQSACNCSPLLFLFTGGAASGGVLHGTFAPRSRRRKDDLTSLRELRALSKPQDHRPSHLDLRASLQKERLCLPRRGTVGVPSVGKVDVFGMLVVGSSL